jgi:asparagine synthase (glutamine-hydrolysing)
MCGIAGFCSPSWDKKEVILQMNKQLFHRGPDGGGFWWDEKTGMTLGHRRLAIVDLKDTGAQPMESHNGRYVIIFNGEIYNAAGLGQKLKEEGYVAAFRGTSDTEVLLEAISAYGMKKALSLCLGMFAIALFDKETGEITLARDRVGEKPLYYGYVKGQFVFASDLAAIRVVPDFTGELDEEAVAAYLRYGYVPTPLSIYKNIRKCKPGYMLTARYPYREFREEAYFDLQKEYEKGQQHPFTGSFAEAVEELDQVLTDAVKSQMVSDVPLGAFLSGGIDSSVVVSLMQKISAIPVKTFTIGFEDESFNEADEAAQIAAYLGTDHTSLIIGEKQLQEVIVKIPEIFTEPFADSSQIPTYLVSRLAREQVTVSLSGDAGDELFCGYNTYWKCADLYRKLAPLPGALKKAGGSLLACPPFRMQDDLYRAAHCLKADNIAGFHEAVCYDTSDALNGLLEGGFAKKCKRHGQQCGTRLPSNAAVEDEMMLRDLLSYHPDDILVKVDRSGMAVSLENRVPMLDRRVLELACSLPVSYKYGMVEGKGISKRVLKEVLYRYVPRELMDRPKKGFSVPLGRWLSEGSVHQWAGELLADSHLVRDNILDKKAADRLWSYFNRTGRRKSLLWNVVVLEQWYRSQEG